MPHEQEPNWLPIADLPLFADLVDGMLQDTEEMVPLFREAQGTPWLLDDATVERAVRLYRERLEYLALNEEQLARWQTGKLSRRQQREVERLGRQTAKNRELVTGLLAVLEEIQKNTIDGETPAFGDQILTRDDARLALDVLSGKLKLPR